MNEKSRKGHGVQKNGNDMVTVTGRGRNRKVIFTVCEFRKAHRMVPQKTVYRSKKHHTI
jgi:hypothetical protein